MKIPTSRPVSSPRNQQGAAVIVVLAFLSILLIYTFANIRSLNLVTRELRLLDQRQTQHWQKVTVAQTNPQP